MKEFDIIYNQALSGMGFIPNSLKAMSIKPNILGSFSMFFANIRGFSGANIEKSTALKLLWKNAKWMIAAKKKCHLEVPSYLKDLIAHVSSNASGCRYCQAHTAHTAHSNGVSIEKLQNVWEFRTSDLFTTEEKAALEFAFAAGSVPNQVTSKHKEDLRAFFTEEQIIEIVATVAMFGFLNRWNDSMATPLEEVPYQFADKYLSKNWEIGKHRATIN